MAIFEKIPRAFLKWLIVFLAAGNLIFLFVFNYQLPGFIQKLFSGSDSTVSEDFSEPLTSELTSDSDFQILVPSQPLSYDGAEALNLMDGVTVTDASGAAQTDIQIFSVIKAGPSRKEKVIEYSATDRNGNRITASRQLTLSNNYTGPLIEVLGDVPALPEEDISSLTSVLLSNNLIHADDGFGKDVTSAITSSVKSEADVSGNAVVTLTVTNMVNDSYSADIIVPTIISGPAIRLTTDKVTINVGDQFNFYNYIDFAQDANGNSLSNHINMNGSVDTSTPGEYVLEFSCFDSEGNTSPIKTLTVTVE